MDMLMLYMTLWVAGASEPNREKIDIGARRELFVDDYLIEVLENAQRILHHPTPRDIVTRGLICRWGLQAFDLLPLTSLYLTHGKVFLFISVRLLDWGRAKL